MRGKAGEWEEIRVDTEERQIENTQKEGHPRKIRMKVVGEKKKADRVKGRGGGQKEKKEAFVQMRFTFRRFLYCKVIINKI